jgi:hypothetical protein
LGRSALSLAFLSVAFATAGSRSRSSRHHGLGGMPSPPPASVPGRAPVLIAFVNLIAVYAAIFSLFVERCSGRRPALLSVGFAAIFAFVPAAGSGASRSAPWSPTRRSQRAAHARRILWLFPPSSSAAGCCSPAWRAAANTGCADRRHDADRLIVFTVSRDVAIFLVDEASVRGVLLPHPAAGGPGLRFPHLYSLLIILFASAYHIISQYTGNSHFYVGGAPRALSFSESIYFSIISISTVGYGDIVPHSSAARLLASIEVVCGFMLLLFGVSELLEYTREHRGEDRTPRRSARR